MNKLWILLFAMVSNCSFGSYSPAEHEKSMLVQDKKACQGACMLVAGPTVCYNYPSFCGILIGFSLCMAGEITCSEAQVNAQALSSESGLQPRLANPLYYCAHLIKNSNNVLHRQAASTMQRN